jgi:transcription-repair coupling factor (superfamily II helicase)
VRGVDIMKKILNFIGKTPYFKELLTKYKANEELYITNTNDNISLLMLIYLFNKNDESLLIVTPNLYKAQKVYDSLTNLLKEDQVSFYPQDEFITTEMLAMSKEFKFERINTIKKIIENKKSIVVTNTTGLLKYQLPLSKWEKAIIRLLKGGILDITNLSKTLISYGYQRGLTVEKQGEFSLRGGILDVFPLNSENPLRIDFFDDEVDSIRYFDINTQRSTIKTKEAIIYPLYEFFYSDKELDKIKYKIEDLVESNSFSEETLNRINGDLENLENHNEVEKLSRYISILEEKPETIVDYLGNKSVVYWDNKKIKENYNDIIRDITDWYDNTGDYPKVGFDLIKDMNYIYSGKSLYLDVFGDNRIKNKSKIINVRAKETVLYNNNLHMAIADFKKYDKYTTLIIAFRTIKSLKQFVDLIDDKVNYSIIGINDKIQEKRVNFIVEENAISFELFDINTILLTEENLFKRKELKKARYKSSIKDAKKLTNVEELKKGDHIVHYDHGIGRFLGVINMTVGKNTNDYIHIAYKGDDSLYIPIENIKLIQKFIGSEGTKPRLNKLGGAEWTKTKQKVRKKIKDIADKLIKLYAAREEAKGY